MLLHAYAFQTEGNSINHLCRPHAPQNCTPCHRTHTHAPLEQTSEESESQRAEEQGVSPNDADTVAGGKIPKLLPRSVTVVPDTGGALDGTTPMTTAMSNEKEAMALVSDDATESVIVAEVPGAAGGVRQTTEEDASQPSESPAVSPMRA